MHGTMRRNWKRTIAALILGSAASGSWIGGSAAAYADPVPMAKPKAEEPNEVAPVWTRSSTPLPTHAPSQPATPSVGPVVPAVARVPAIPVPPLTIPVVAPPGPNPVFSAPPIPELKPVPIPTTPVEPPIAIPSPLQIAPSAPPVKSADPVKPIIPAVPDFNLRPAAAGNSVKPEARSVPPIPVVPPSAGPGAVPAIPTSLQPKPLEVEIAPTVKDVFALPGTIVPLPIPTPPRTPGANPMRIPSRFTPLAAVTGIALAFAPTSPVVRAQDSNDPVQLRKDLDAANKKLEDAEKEIKRLAALLDGKKDERGFRLESDPGAVEEVKRLKDRVAALERQVAAMQSSTSLRPGPAIVGKGTIRVVNEYPVAISIVINEKSYRVEPNTTLNVEVPAGEFSYQLLQSGIGATPVRSSIKDKEVVTLRVK